MVKKVRESSPNTILLDGGDQFQGTTWFGVYKGLEAVTFMNLDCYDAMVVYLLMRAQIRALNVIIIFKLIS